MRPWDGNRRTGYGHVLTTPAKLGSVTGGSSESWPGERLLARLVEAVSRVDEPREAALCSPTSPPPLHLHRAAIRAHCAFRVFWRCADRLAADSDPTRIRPPNSARFFQPCFLPLVVAPPPCVSTRCTDPRPQRPPASVRQLGCPARRTGAFHVASYSHRGAIVPGPRLPAAGTCSRL
jgi:hypothetical protein